MGFLESFFLWCQEPINLLVFCACVVFALWFGVRRMRLKRRTYALKIHDPKGAHRWKMSEFLDKPTYCNSCLQMCISGSCCESCGLCICTESRCLKMASTSQSSNLFQFLLAIKCLIFGCVEIYHSAACVSNVSHRVATSQSLQTLGVCGVIKQVTKTVLKRWTVTPILAV